MRWMLLQHFESRFIALPVFATGFFRELGGAARQTPQEAAQYLMMHLALEQLKGVLRRYQDSGRSGASIAALASQMEEFRTAGIAPQMLREVKSRIGQASFAEKIDELLFDL